MDLPLADKETMDTAVSADILQNASSEDDNDSSYELATVQPLEPRRSSTFQRVTVRIRKLDLDRLISQVENGQQPLTMTLLEGHPWGPTPNERHIDSYSQAPHAQTQEDLVNTDTAYHDDVPLVCTCKGDASGRRLVECSNGRLCLIGWFHFECVGLDKPLPPYETWFCPRCIEYKIGNATFYQPPNFLQTNFETFRPSAPASPLNKSLNRTAVWPAKSATGTDIAAYRTRRKHHQIEDDDTFDIEMAEAEAETEVERPSFGISQKWEKHMAKARETAREQALKNPGSKSRDGEKWSLPPISTFLHQMNPPCPPLSAELDRSVARDGSRTLPMPTPKHPSPWSAPIGKSFFDEPTMASSYGLSSSTSNEPVEQDSPVTTPKTTSAAKTKSHNVDISSRSRHWTDEEQALLVATMEQATAEFGHIGEKQWEIVYGRLRAAGVHRTLGGMKMAWLRGLRERSGVDERRDKTGPMTSGVRKKVGRLGQS